jgi:hypothetical protein
VAHDASVRAAVLVTLLGATALAAAVGADADARTEPRLQVPAELRVVSYYPADAGWTLMWEHWRPERLAADFRRLRGLNANTVRLIVFPKQFGYPVPTQLYAGRLAQAVALASAAGLRVQLTLFDWWYDYDDGAGSKRWLRALLAPTVGDARVAFVELRNEIDATDPAAVAWARELVPWLRGYVRGIPVTLSVAGADPVGRLRTLARGLGPAARPDFFTAHYFTGGGELAASVFRGLRQAAAPTPLWIGELGYPTSTAVSGYASLSRTGSSQEAAQSHFLKTAFEAARQVGLPRPGIWILDDFAEGAIPASDVSEREPEYTFGLFRADGSPKLAARTLRRLFGRGPDLDFNGGFEQTVSADDGSPQPAMWAATGLDGMAVERDTTVARTGVVSVRLRSSTPAYGRLGVAPIGTAVQEGRCAEAAVWSRGRADEGRVRLMIGWFDASSRRIARRSDRLPLDSRRWTRARVRACPPPGAAYARIVVEAVGLKGVAWVDDVTFGWR